MQNFVARLQAAMLLRGFDDVQLARRAGLSHSTVWRILHAETDAPRFRTWHKLAEALEVTVTELVGDEQLDFWNERAKSATADVARDLVAELARVPPYLRAEAARQGIAAIRNVLRRSDRKF